MAKRAESNLSPSTTPRSPNEVAICVPIQNPAPPGYRHSHVDARLTPRHAETMQMVTSGLDREGARLRDGSRVTTPPAALRWLLERIEEGL